MVTISSRQPPPNICFDVFVEPFRQGFYNVRDAYRGQKTESVAAGAFAPPITRGTPLALTERVTAFVVGLLLVVPLVNALVLMILKNMNSNYLYAPVRQLASPAPVSMIGDGPAITEPAPTPQELIERKTAALASLTQIDAMGNTRNGHFALDPAVLTFDLDAILLRYPADQAPSRLCDFLDWAGIEQRKKSSFRRVVSQYDSQSSGYQEAMVRGLLSKMHNYFLQRRAQITAGTQAETDLKEQFSGIVDRCIDASSNCVDQMLSQIQGMMLDVVADGFTATRGGRALERIKLRAGHELCKYRCNLVKEICARQNPGEHHMADLERMVIERLAERLGMQGGIFVTGARYAGMIRNIDAKARNALNAFNAEYKPLDFLANELRTYHGNARKLRNEIFLWANNYFGLNDEDDAAATAATSAAANAIPAALNMNRRMSEDFDALPANEGGNLTPAATLYLLQASNLVSPVGA